MEKLKEISVQIEKEKQGQSGGTNSCDQENSSEFSFTSGYRSSNSEEENISDHDVTQTESKGNVVSLEDKTRSPPCEELPDLEQVKLSDEDTSEETDQVHKISFVNSSGTVMATSGSMASEEVFRNESCSTPKEDLLLKVREISECLSRTASPSIFGSSESSLVFMDQTGKVLATSKSCMSPYGSRRNIKIVESKMINGSYPSSPLLGRYQSPLTFKSQESLSFSVWEKLKEISRNLESQNNMNL